MGIYVIYTYLIIFDVDIVIYCIHSGPYSMSSLMVDDVRELAYQKEAETC